MRTDALSVAHQQVAQIGAQPSQFHRLPISQRPPRFSIAAIASTAHFRIE